MHINVNVLFTEKLCVHSLAMTLTHNQANTMALDIKSPRMYKKISPEWNNIMFTLPDLEF